ncbi:MAG TPA: MFS transporter, partial [Microbacteriaceae bacterium]|nr:MFS transporter [Microbacteriaceae bacterium]
VIGLTGAALTMLLMLGAGTASSLTSLIIGLILTGLATALSNAGLARQSVATVPAKDAATGTAAINTARYIGAAVGMSIVSMIAATGNINEGWNHVVWFGAAASLVIAVAVAFLSRRTR